MSTRPAPPSSRARRAERAKYLDVRSPVESAFAPRDPRARYLRLLQAWVECLPHQPAKRRFVEGALARARAQVVGRRVP